MSRDDHPPNNDDDEDDDDDDVFPKAGVTVSFLLHDFVEECGGIETFDGFTTEMVCEHIIKRRTNATQSSYCDLLKQQGRYTTYGDTAQVFISHAHCYIFLDVLNALQQKFPNEKDQTTTVIWFDLFSINQHQTTVWSFQWLSTTFQSAIQDMGHTIMVMSPWNDPIPFTRAWCVYEAYCAATATGNCRFDIAMSHMDQKKFLKDVQHDPEKSINHMLATIRAKKSQCSVESDRESIFAVIETTIGFSQLDAMVLERYREWVIQTSLEALTNCISKASDHTTTHDGVDDDNIGKKVMNLLHTVGILYKTQGNYTEAQYYLKENAKKRMLYYGAESSEYWIAQRSLAELLHHAGTYEEALRVGQDSVEHQTTLLGEDHPQTLDAIYTVAKIQHSLENWEAAQSLHEACYETQQRVLGINDPRTLNSMNSLAILYDELGLLNRAEPLYRECLEGRKTVLGDDHFLTINSMSNLGTFFCVQGKYEDAMPLYEECLNRRKTILGDSHPKTLDSINNLVILYRHLGMPIEAENLLIES